MKTISTHPEWTILLAEDEFDSQQLLSRVLRHYQIQFRLVSNGEECIDALRAFTPTLVIMDLAMPRMDGWETLSQIRSSPRTASLPVVAMTAFHSDEVARGAVTAGFDAYLRKPITAAVLIQELERVLTTPRD